MPRRDLLIACVSLTIFSLSGVVAQPQGSGPRDKAVSNTEIRLSATDNVGRIAPDFELPTLDGGKLKLSGYRGKAVLLNFWATWCGPCRIEMPWFVKLEKQYGDQGFQVIGVALDTDSRRSVVKFAKQMGVNYPIAIGSDTVSDLYGGVEALPSSFYIDRNGRIIQQVSGLISYGEIERSIRKALESPPPSIASGPASQAPR